MVQNARCDRSTLIRPYLYLGSVNDARDSAHLHTLGITHLLSAAAEFPPPPSPGIETLHIPLFDRTNERIATRFNDAEMWICEAKRAGGRIFVYCQHGISRSATLCIAHLMQKEETELYDSISQIRSLRPDVEPNPSFLGELRSLEYDLFGRFVTTEQLTPMDPGLVKCETLKAQAERAVQECLALALVSTEQSSTIATTSELAATTSIERALCANDLDFVESIVLDAYDSFAGSTARDKAARMSLARIMRSLASRSLPLKHPGIVERIQDIRLTDRWTDFVLDVPFAPKYLEELLHLLDYPYDQ